MDSDFIHNIMWMAAAGDVRGHLVGLRFLSAFSAHPGTPHHLGQHITTTASFARTSFPDGQKEETEFLGCRQPHPVDGLSQRTGSTAS